MINKLLNDNFEENKIIKLSELGNKITVKLLLTCRCPHIFTIVMFLKDENKPIAIDDIFSRFYGDSVGNKLFLEHVIGKAFCYGLIE